MSRRAKLKGMERTRERQLILLFHRAITQIALLAVTDPQRVFELADTLEPMAAECAREDAVEGWRERLETYLSRYPDGADWLREPLVLTARQIEESGYFPLSS